MRHTALIIIPSFGHFEYVEQAIRSAYESTREVSPIVALIDDASPDWDQARIDRLVKEFPSLLVGRFETNGGLTRSWNLGLQIAKELKTTYAVTTNSDVLFAKNWDAEIINALNTGADLTGPTTNAPGTCDLQYVGHYSKSYSRDTAEATVDEVQAELTKTQAGATKLTTLNGFCLVAKTATWHANAFDTENVFRPTNPRTAKGQYNPTPLMTLNEDELQGRWHAAGLHTAVALGSYVFHYRAVSRGDKYKRGDWARMTPGGTA